MTFVRVDQTLVQHLEHVGLDVGQAEPGGFGSHLPHQICAGWTLQRPIEEVRLNGPQDALVSKCSARK
jgi:hypothetical protein